jgi:hypothetical protein
MNRICNVRIFKFFSSFIINVKTNKYYYANFHYKIAEYIIHYIIFYRQKKKYIRIAVSYFESGVTFRIKKNS